VLDSIMREKLKNNPAELSVWIKVQHIKSGPTTEEPTPPVVAAVASNGGQGEEVAVVEPRVNGNKGGVLVGLVIPMRNSECGMKAMGRARSVKWPGRVSLGKK
jgi:hypothetical protein